MTDETDASGGPSPRHDPVARTAGRPALTTAIAAALMVAVTLGNHSVAATHGQAQRLGYLLGGLIFGVIVWAVCYAITLRKASRRWQLLSLGLMMAIGVATAAAGLGTRHDGIRRDALETIDQVKQAMAAGQAGRIEAGADAGPMTRLTAVVGNMILADSNAFASASNAAGVPQMIWPAGLTPSSPLLDHCDRVAALPPRADALAARYPAYLDAARAEGGRLVAEGKLPQSELDGMIRGLAGQQESFHTQWTLAGQLAGGAGEICRIFARRHWRKGPKDEVIFTDPADRAAMMAVRARLSSVMKEIEANSAKARARSSDAMRQLDRL
jgi:hypothetical protein